MAFLSPLVGPDANGPGVATVTGIRRLTGKIDLCQNDR